MNTTTERLCINCKHHRQLYSAGLGGTTSKIPPRLWDHRCTRMARPDPVRGGWIPDGLLKYCSEERSAGFCGPDGKYFEPKPEADKQ